MKKPLFLTIFAAILSLSLVSAGYDGYYYPSHNSYGNYYGDGYTYYEKTTYVTEKQIVERNYRPIPYYSSTYYYAPYQYGPVYQYTYPSYSNYRYDRNYVYENSFSYDKPYYYAPRFDYNLGYYNWRY